MTVDESGDGELPGSGDMLLGLSWVNLPSWGNSANRVPSDCDVAVFVYPISAICVAQHVALGDELGEHVGSLSTNINE